MKKFKEVFNRKDFLRWAFVVIGVTIANTALYFMGHEDGKQEVLDAVKDSLKQES